MRAGVPGAAAGGFLAPRPLPGRLRPGRRPRLLALRPAWEVARLGALSPWCRAAVSFPSPQRLREAGPRDPSSPFPSASRGPPESRALCRHPSPVLWLGPDLCFTRRLQ